MKKVQSLLFTVLVCFAVPIVTGYDPSPLQDFCVANEGNNGVFVNGKICLNPNDVTADHFFYGDLAFPQNTTNMDGSNARLITADLLPGLNTLGISFARIDFAPGGLNPPHHHPRGSEVLYVLQGTVLAGFITSNRLGEKNKLYTKVLTAGQIFVFPIGLVHFQLNLGNTSATCLAALGSQNPGRYDVPSGIFGTSPLLSDSVLTKAFHVDIKTIRKLQKPYN